MPPIKELAYFRGGSFKQSNQRKFRRQQKGHTVTATPRHGEIDQSFYKIYEAGLKRNFADDRWYLDLFANKHGLLSGDITPNYARIQPDEIRRIRQFLPETKAVFLIRHPVDRYLSHLSMDVRGGKFRERAMASEKAIFKHLNSISNQQRSFPSRVWRNWHSVFGDAGAKFWFFEDIALRPEGVIDEISKFVGASSFHSLLEPGYNRKKSNKRFAVPASILDHIYDHFAEEIEACGKEFGSHALNWRTSRE